MGILDAPAALRPDGRVRGVVRYPLREAGPGQHVALQRHVLVPARPAGRHGVQDDPGLKLPAVD